MSKEYTLSISIFDSSIREQLESQECMFLDEGDYDKYEKIRTSIHMLGFHGYVSDSQIKKMWEKFYKEVGKLVYFRE